MGTRVRAAVVAIGLAVALMGSGGLHTTLGQEETPEAATPASFSPDAFYEPPAEIPSAPGVLLRSEPLTDRELPAGAQAWRILYTTTFADDAPATAVATVLAPSTPPPGPRPAISWTHGTVGILQQCMPSLFATPFAGVPALDQIVDEGWVLVATDYAPNAQGVHPYIMGEGQARSALDAVRAARQMPELTLAEQTVAWGHSQGGHAALWSAITEPDYAPEVALRGVAAFAPASDMEQILIALSGTAKGATLVAYIAESYSQYFPDVVFDEIVTSGAREIARELAGLCQFDPRDIPTLEGLVADLGATPVLTDPSAGALGERLRDNAPDHPIAVPLLIVQGLADAVIDPAINDQYVAERCAAGQDLAYWRVPGRDHGGIVAPGSPIAEPLIAWTRDRFAGEPVLTGCREETIE